MSDRSSKVYFEMGGNNLVISPGGGIKSEAGSVLLSNISRLAKPVADFSAEKTYYMVAEKAGKITKLSTVIDGVTASADATATFSINGVAVTGGVVTMPLAGTAAGQVNSAVPTGANAVAVGDVISFVVTGGGSGGSPSGEAHVEITG